MGPESVVKFYWYVVECLRTYQEPRRSFKCMPYAESNMHPLCTPPASHYKKRCPSLLYNPVCTTLCVQPCLYNMFILIQLVFPSLHNQYRSITCFAYSEIYYAISQHCHFDLHHTPSYVQSDTPYRGKSSTPSGVHLPSIIVNDPHNYQRYPGFLRSL